MGAKWNLTRGFRCRNSLLELCGAQSAGISLLKEENGQPIFRWYGVAGEYAPHLWGTTPREFSPCGTVLDSLPVLSERERASAVQAGGHMLWIELPARVDAMKLWRAALSEHISILP